MYRTYNTKVKLLGLNPTLNYLKILGFYQKPHIFWSTAPFSMIFIADKLWMRALSTQASEKSVWLFSLFGFGRFLAIALICIALLAFHLHLALYRTYNTKVKLLGLNPTLNYFKILGFHQIPHIFWSTAPFSMIFNADKLWMRALST